jgi:mannose-6-phosphate isomerase
LLYENDSYSINQGECLLLPAGIDKVRFQATSAQLIEIYL